MEKVKINDICNISNGYAFKSDKYISENGARIIRITNVQKGKIVDNDPKLYPFSELNKLDAYKIFEGDILMSLTGNVGRVGRYPKELLPAYINQRVCRVMPKNEKLDTNFLFHFLNSDVFENEAIKNSAGAAQLNLSTKWLGDFEIPLPPLATQQKIATILDQADAIIQNNRAIVQKYDALTQSLFLDMFGDPVKNEKGWEMKTLKDFGTSRLGKMLDVKKIIGNNLKPYLRNSNVQWFRFELNDLLKMDFDEKDKVEFSLKVGDILMCEGGEIGRCAIWKDEIEDCYFQKAIHRIRLNDKYVLPEYFVHMFKNIADNGGLDEFKSAATISHLTGEKLKKMRMPIPPIELQNQFAERVAVIEAQKQQAQQALAKSEELFASLLQRAFKGEL